MCMCVRGGLCLATLSLCVCECVGVCVCLTRTQGKPSDYFPAYGGDDVQPAEAVEGGEAVEEAMEEGGEAEEASVCF
jgi:hypothetical protein